MTLESTKKGMGELKPILSRNDEASYYEKGKARPSISMRRPWVIQVVQPY